MMVGLFMHPQLSSCRAMRTLPGEEPGVVLRAERGPALLLVPALLVLLPVHGLGADCATC